RFIGGLGKAGLLVGRKGLSDLAIREPAAVAAIFEKAKTAIAVGREGEGLRVTHPLNAAMIDPSYVQCMERYNPWQNENLYAAADALSEAERRRERRAFFGSIHATLSHLLWADRTWMSRLAGTPSPGGSIPESVSLYDDWGGLKHERKAFDAVVIDWADRLDSGWLQGDFAYYSGAIKSHLRKP